jgi:hypothetical protein
MKIFFLLIFSITLSLASNVLIDTKTGLTWQDDFDAQDIEKDWDGAVLFCKNLSLEGHDDWRLPIVKELETIIDRSKPNRVVVGGLKNIGDDGYYWSASPHETQEEFAWMMNFTRGYEYINYKTYERYIRCVRGEMKEI